MKLAYYILSVILLAVVFVSCEKYPTEPAPSVPSKEILRNIDLKQIDYNILQIQSTNDLVLSSTSVKRIGAGKIVQGEYTEIVSTEPSYAKSSGQYSLKFMFTMPLDSTKTTMEFVLRYYFTNGDHADIEQNLLTIKYPYQSALPYIKSSIHWYPYMYFQDVDRIGNTLFYHPLGGDGLYSYDLVAKQAKRLVMYGAGDHIACADNFVFYEDDHRTVKRYNLSTQTTDLVIPYFKDLQNDLYGMAASDDVLYVLTKRAGYISLLRFDYNGNLLETIPFPRASYYLAAHDGILYTNDYTNKEMVRFNVKNKIFLPSKPIVSPMGNGFKIYGNQLYYTDDSKRFVGIVDLSEIENDLGNN